MDLLLWVLLPRVWQQAPRHRVKPIRRGRRGQIAHPQSNVLRYPRSTFHRDESIQQGLRE